MLHSKWTRTKQHLQIVGNNPISHESLGHIFIIDIDSDCIIIRICLASLTDDDRSNVFISISEKIEDFKIDKVFAVGSGHLL